MSIFPRRKSNVVFFVFSYLVKEYKYRKQSTNTANVVLLSANQIAYIFFRVSDKFYLHLLIGLISSKKYLRVAKNLVPVLKGFLK